MPTDMAKRQGDIATFALLSFDGKDEAMKFLNTRCESLGARPLDLAIASDAGYEQVRQAIAELADSRGQ